MNSAVFNCPKKWAWLLPTGVFCAKTAAELSAAEPWELLVLTRTGCERLAGRKICCGILLLPGDRLPPPGAGTIVTCGLSVRDSLTLSSLREPVLCVQRALPRPDGGVIEPQEFLLPPLPGPVERLLPLLGLRLLQMPLNAERLSW